MALNTKRIWIKKRC